jgi:hypothetical protein
VKELSLLCFSGGWSYEGSRIDIENKTLLDLLDLLGNLLANIKNSQKYQIFQKQKNRNSMLFYFLLFLNL